MTNVFQTFLERFEAIRASSSRQGRLELLELVDPRLREISPSFRLPIWCWPSYNESANRAVLRSELIVEFEKQGLSTGDALKAAELFFEMANKEV